MKQILIILLFSANSLLAGNADANKVYNQIEKNYDAFSMSLSKKMIDFFDMDIDFNGKEKLITGDFEKGRMLIVNETTTSLDINHLFEEEGFEWIDFEEGENDDNQVSLWIIRNGKEVKEAHFVVIEDEKIILLSVYGKMKVSNKN
tara:strand:- start:1626 stop:2063 length:438 start_codon:yes stop_codon:yes gene_type:complete